MNLELLPREVIHYISTFLGNFDFSVLAATNSNIRKIIQADKRMEQIKLENVNHIRGSILQFSDEGRRVEIFRINFGNKFSINAIYIAKEILLEILYDLNIWPDIEHCKLNNNAYNKGSITESDMKASLSNLIADDCRDFSRNKIKFYYYWLASYQSFDTIQNQIISHIKEFLTKHNKIDYEQK